MEPEVEFSIHDEAAPFAYVSASWRGVAREEQETSADHDHLSGDPFSVYDEFVQYPSDEDGSTPPAAQSQRYGSQRSAEVLTSSDDNGSVERPDESEGSSPAFLDLGTCNFCS